MSPTRFESPSARSSHSTVHGAAIVLLALALAVEPAAAQAPAEADSESALDLQGDPRKHRKRQRRPVKMGTSGGNVNDITARFCCSGTLGGLVRKGSELFVLSNNHVIALSNLGQPGDGVSQPGLIDNRCNAPNKNTLAELSDFRKLKFNRGKNLVDAAIAKVVNGAVDESGAMVAIGVPGNEAVAPRLGMPVQKAGRTTGLTEGVVDLVNVKVRVQYSEECSDDAAIFVALFKKQFLVVSNSNESFSGPGDSGSVIVEDVHTCPRQVGLLFAGNDQVTVGSKMSTVLKQLRKLKPGGPAQLVGCNPTVAAGARLDSQGGLLGPDERELRLAERIQARVDDAMLAVEGVQAMGIGRSRTHPSSTVFKVYVDKDRADLLTRIPGEIDGIPVEVVESGPFFARSCPRPVESG